MRRRRNRVVPGPVLCPWERRLRAAWRSLPRKERRARMARARMLALGTWDGMDSGWVTLNGVDRSVGYL